MKNSKKRRLEHTRKIAAALESSGRWSGLRLFPLKIRHCISFAAPSINPFSTCFLFIASSTEAGTNFAPFKTKFCIVKWILMQSLQQNHLSFGSSCANSKKPISN